MVTGASSGIGAVITKLLVEEGAHVVACGTNLARLTELVASLGGEKNVTAVQGDLSDPAQVEIIARAGDTVDGLVNNAGIALNAPLLEASWRTGTKHLPST